MQAFIELLVGFMALLAALALSQFGVDLKTSPSAEREVHRVADCSSSPAAAILVEQPAPDC